MHNTFYLRNSEPWNEFTLLGFGSLSCKKREVELQCQIKWAWKHEGILNILLQQSVMASVTEFIHP